MHHDSKECWQEDELLHIAFSNLTLLTIVTSNKFQLEMIVFKLATFQGELVNVKEICLVNVQYGNIHRTVTFIVVKEHCLNLLRLNRFEPLGINISGIHHLIPNSLPMSEVDPNDTPICVKARKVPHALKEKTDTELDKLIEQGILEPVNHPIWSSLISTLVNPDGKVRI
ncbi:hypothetical protein T02_14347 [Trichinella nativa]|uniref:Uncharacterized protein n=1 Tax=Trichinella nativa TaxID=6335 RepID=A0A0V1LDF2_9BILA|nr:hypothetical protein T02_14347 [Trichinella nativa]